MIILFINLLSPTASQSCIRNELLAAIEELEHRNNHPVVSNPSNQNGSTGCAQIEGLNNTIQEIIGELQERIQGIKKEMHRVQEDINHELKGIQQIQ